MKSNFFVSASSRVISGIMYRTSQVIIENKPLLPCQAYFPDNDRHSINYPLHIHDMNYLNQCIFHKLFIKSFLKESLRNKYSFNNLNQRIPCKTRLCLLSPGKALRGGRDPASLIKCDNNSNTIKV